MAVVGMIREPRPARFGDRDVAKVIARYTGACLGLLAFAVTSVAGLLTGNAVTVTLSRSLFALFLFCVLGLVLGGAAQLVVAEYERNRESEIRRRLEASATGASHSSNVDPRAAEVPNAPGDDGIVTLNRARSPIG